MSGLRDNMQSEQMGLIKLNDTSVKNMASNLTKLKQVNARVATLLSIPSVSYLARQCLTRTVGAALCSECAQGKWSD